MDLIRIDVCSFEGICMLGGLAFSGFPGIIEEFLNGGLRGLGFGKG